MPVFKPKFVQGLGMVWIFLTGAVSLALAFAFVQFLSFSNQGQNLANFLAQPVSLRQTENTAGAKIQAQTLLSDLFGSNRSETAGKDKVIFNSEQPAGEAETAPLDENQADSAGFKKVLISEVLLEADSSKQEFVELFNPNDFAVDLAGWELRKKSASGADSVLVSSKKFSGRIKAQGYFLISHPDFQTAFGADLSWSSSSYGLSKDNTVYLLDDSDRLVDKLGWGLAKDYEKQAAPAPDKGQSLSRKSAIDLDNNLSDFVLSNPSARNSSSYGEFIAPTVASPASSPQVGLVTTSSPSPTQTSQAVSTPSVTPTSSLAPLPSPSPVEISPSIETPVPSLAPSLLPAQIIEVQFGLEGNANADYVKMYNPNPAPLDLVDYKLVKKTAGSGAEYSLKSWSQTEEAERLIPGSSYFFWVNSNYQEKIGELSALNLKIYTTTNTISETNGIGLKYQNQIIPIDSVNW